MSSLKEIRIRISSVSSTRQITSAMRMVSASKLKKAQDKILKVRPYATKLREMLEDVSMNYSKKEELPLIQPREIRHVLLVLITSNRGLCGGFNLNAAKFLLEITQEYFQKGAQVHVMAFGKKGYEMIKNYPGTTIQEMNHDSVDMVDKETLYPIAGEIMDQFITQKYDKIELIYNQFKSAATQKLTRENFLPVIPPKGKPSENASDNLSDKKVNVLNNFIMEPDAETVFQKLLPEMLRIQFYKAFADSSASEHGARMVSMQKATENASNLIDELSLTYNKARQAGITREIIEIISGADAQRG